MARKRKGTAKRGGPRKQATSSRAQATRKRRPPRRSRAGARATRREEAAHRVEAEVVALVGAGDPAGHDPELEPAPRAPEPAWAERASGVPDYARLVAAQQEEPAAARRREDAQAELGRRREEAEGREPGADVPGLRDIGVELAIGSLRLARTVATAPLRIALAFLRDG